jgi:hypothetical protein
VGSASYTLQPRKRERALLVLGLIDLCASVPLVLAGFGLLLTGAWQGAIAFLGGLLGLWAGSVMTWGRVYVNATRLRTMQVRPHRAKRDDIASIDVCRNDLVKVKRVLPIVRLKSGKSFKLLPLAVSSVVGYTRQTEDQQAQMRIQLEEQVREIRAALGVGGHDDVSERATG